jgi:hypothetical protein
MFVSGWGRYEQAKRFQRRRLKKNDEPEKRIAYIGHYCIDKLTICSGSAK